MFMVGFFFLFTECQEVDFISLQKCSQRSWLPCKTTGGVILTDVFINKCSSTSSALWYVLLKDGFAQWGFQRMVYILYSWDIALLHRVN